MELPPECWYCVLERLRSVDCWKRCRLVCRMFDRLLQHYANSRGLYFRTATPSYWMRHCTVCGLPNMEGYVYSMTNIRRLDISGCDVGDVGISMLTSLQHLNASKTRVTDISVSKLTSLQILNVSKTSVTDAGISMLTSLQILNVSKTSVTDAGISMLTSLHSLIAVESHITDNSVSRLKSLTELVAVFTPGVTDAGIRLLTRLRKLRAPKDTVTGEIIAGLSSLQDFGMPESSIDLRYLTALHELRIPGYTLETSGLTRMTRLNTLNVMRGVFGVNDTDICCLTGLRSLNVSKCTTLTNAGMSTLTLLRELRASHTMITDAYVSILTSLEVLDISECLAVTNAGISVLTRLHTLGVRYSTSITGAGLRCLPSLRDLSMSGSGMTDEDIIVLTQVHVLHLRDMPNTVTDRGVSTLTHLRLLDITGSRGISAECIEYLRRYVKVEDLNQIPN